MQRARRSLISLCFGFLLFSSPGVALASEVTTLSPSPFPMPAGLEAAVEFWIRVFSEYGSSQLVYFDPLDMSKIYEVTDVGEESRTNDYIRAERERIATAHGVD